ncbi:MAG: diphthamide biosynthesis enzyme Dph2 [Candidatus Aenigmarchaeota archaeon]|nr:diphthamide biosynthesis enzyme Dph2 [Candidatus Aenigmarchaeota archaeon]
MLSKSCQKKIVQVIEKIKPKRIAVTMPEGMKMDLKEIAQLIEYNNCEVVLIVEPCFGACDLRDWEAQLLDCDLLLHLGHSDFGLKTMVPTEYIEVFSDYSPFQQVKNNLKKLEKYKKIALCSTVQHILELEKIKDFLEQNKKIVFVPKSKKAKYDGQVLGCDASGPETINSNIDCVLFVGGGLFHAFQILEKTTIPVLTIGPDKKEITDITGKRELILKRKIIKQKKFEYSKTIGLLVSFKRGQLKKNIFEIKKKLEGQGKEVYILAMDYISKEKILGIDAEVLVNTACPRIEEDNIFDVPVINLEDIIFQQQKQK